MKMEAWSGVHAQYANGQRVTVDDRDALGHCRAPFYLRGQTGTIVEIHGAFRDPEKLAYHAPGLPAQMLYKVSFRRGDLWGDACEGADETLEADIYENWLRAPAEAEGA